MMALSPLVKRHNLRLDRRAIHQDESRQSIWGPHDYDVIPFLISDLPEVELVVPSLGQPLLEQLHTVKDPLDLVLHDGAKPTLAGPDRITNRQRRVRLFGGPLGRGSERFPSDHEGQLPSRQVRSNGDHPSLPA